MENKVKKLLIQSFSGGIDSTTTLYQAAMKDGFDLIIPINYTYGQKNIVETIVQKELINYIKNDLGDEIVMDVLNINIEAMFPNGMNFYKELRDSDVIKEKTNTEYYTPMRNMLFSTIAAMIGELTALSKTEVYEVHIGIGLHKHSDIYAKDYWDITPEFVEKMNGVFALNDAVNLKLYAPFKDSTKTQLVGNALEMQVPYKQTWTCYNPSTSDGIATPCLDCEACQEREKAFLAHDVLDGNDYMCQFEDDGSWDAIDSDLHLYPKALTLFKKLKPMLHFKIEPTPLTPLGDILKTTCISQDEHLIIDGNIIYSFKEEYGIDLPREMFEDSSLTLIEMCKRYIAGSYDSKPEPRLEVDVLYEEPEDAEPEVLEFANCMVNAADAITDIQININQPLQVWIDSSKSLVDDDFQETLIGNYFTFEGCELPEEIFEDTSLTIYEICKNFNDKIDKEVYETGLENFCIECCDPDCKGC